MRTAWHLMSLWQASKVFTAWNTVSQSSQGAERYFPNARDTDNHLGIPKVSHHRPQEFPGHNGTFRTRRGAAGTTKALLVAFKCFSACKGIFKPCFTISVFKSCFSNYSVDPRWKSDARSKSKETEGLYTSERTDWVSVLFECLYVLAFGECVFCLCAYMGVCVFLPVTCLPNVVGAFVCSQSGFYNEYELDSRRQSKNACKLSLKPVRGPRSVS